MSNLNLDRNQMVSDGGEDGLGQGEAPANPLLMVHQLLRGRYLLAIGLGVVGAVAGAALGFKSQSPEYVSQGLIRVKPVVPKILFQNEQNGLMPMFDAFVQSQVTLLTNQRLIDLAMQSPTWQSLKRGIGPAQSADFAESLEATRARGSEMIVISFTDRDPNAARLGVQSTIEAYDRLYGQGDASELGGRLKVLEDRRAKLDADLKRLNERMNAIASELGSGASSGLLEEMHKAKVSQVAGLETQLRSAELATALAVELSAPATQPAGQAAPESIEALAARSPEMRGMLNRKRLLEEQLVIDGIRLGEQHPSVVNTRATLDLVGKSIEAYTASLQEAGAIGLASMPESFGKPLGQLRIEERNIRALYERAKGEASDLGRKSLDVAALRAEADDAQAKLTETNQRIEQLDLESSIGGRVSIENKGDQPLAPSKDKRKQFAAVGGLGLGALGIGLVMAIGFFDRRVRSLSDVRSGRLDTGPVLGILPQLPDDLSDPEQAMLAAHAVHQVRAALQHRHPEKPAPIFAVTSSSPGAGKTSLTLALGMSFAASGSRTLLIDCDIIGGGLTSKMKKVTRRRVGHILRRSGLITTDQLNAALRYARDNRCRMGEALFKLGFASGTDIDHALSIQKETMVGLREALNGDPALECVTGVGTPGLFVMPLGSAKRKHAGQLSYAALRRVIEQVRTRFDVIIIDTGPILGSLEASVVAMAADEVVLTVARGEQRPLLNDAIERLTSAGGKIAGIVLNRADPIELRMSGFSMSVNRRSESTVVEPATTAGLLENSHFQLGPIALAVASQTDATDESRNEGGQKS